MKITIPNTIKTIISLVYLDELLEDHFTKFSAGDRKDNIIFEIMESLEFKTTCYQTIKYQDDIVKTMLMGNERHILT